MRYSESEVRDGHCSRSVGSGDVSEGRRVKLNYSGDKMREVKARVV